MIRSIDVLNTKVNEKDGFKDNKVETCASENSMALESSCASENSMALESGNSDIYIDTCNNENNHKPFLTKSRLNNCRREPTTSTKKSKFTSSIILPPCRICGARASGLHYGVNSCEACKGFFRRALKRPMNFSCTRSKTCDVKGNKRSTCRFCRYKRCLSLGMSRDSIKTGRYSHKKRTRDTIEIKRLQNTPNLATSDSDLDTAINNLITAHDRLILSTTDAPSDVIYRKQLEYHNIYLLHKQFGHHPGLHAELCSHPSPSADHEPRSTGHKDLEFDEIRSCQGLSPARSLSQLSSDSGFQEEAGGCHSVQSNNLQFHESGVSMKCMSHSGDQEQGRVSAVICSNHINQHNQGQATQGLYSNDVNQYNQDCANTSCYNNYINQYNQEREQPNHHDREMTGKLGSGTSREKWDQPGQNGSGLAMNGASTTALMFKTQTDHQNQATTSFWNKYNNQYNQEQATTCGYNNHFNQCNNSAANTPEHSLINLQRKHTFANEGTLPFNGHHQKYGHLRESLPSVSNSRINPCSNEESTTLLDPCNDGNPTNCSAGCAEDAKSQLPDVDTIQNFKKQAEEVSTNMLTNVPTVLPVKYCSLSVDRKRYERQTGTVYQDISFSNFESLRHSHEFVSSLQNTPDSSKAAFALLSKSVNPLKYTHGYGHLSDSPAYPDTSMKDVRDISSRLQAGNILIQPVDGTTNVLKASSEEGWKCWLNLPDEPQSEIFTRTKAWIQGYVNFAKEIPGFSRLCLQDQGSLLKHAWDEFWMLGSYRGYNSTLQVAMTPRGQCFHAEEMATAWGKSYSRIAFQLADILKRYDVSRQLNVLLKAVCIVAPDRCVLVDPDKVSEIHWLMVSCLQLQAGKTSHPGAYSTFPRLISILTSLRELSESVKRVKGTGNLNDICDYNILSQTLVPF